MSKFYILLILFFIPKLSLAADMMCRHLFHTDDRISRSVRDLQEGEQDTTSLRREVKYVIKTEVLHAYLKNLEDHFGSSYKKRDQAAAGTANVTSTKYMTVIKYFQGGKRLSGKIRFRKYYVRQLSDVKWQNLKPAKGFEKKSWWEIKMQHPEFDGVVIKPRLLGDDKDEKKMQTEEWFDYKKYIITNLKTSNSGKDNLIAKFSNFFDALYTTPAMRVENLFAETEYERDSLSLKTASLDNPEKKIDIQLTLDKNIRLTRTKDRKIFTPYGNDETVIEVKIPLQYAGLTPQDLASVPDLVVIKNLIDWLNTTHEAKYPKNKGKMSKIEKHIEKDDYSDDHDAIDEYD